MSKTIDRLIWICYINIIKKTVLFNKSVTIRKERKNENSICNDCLSISCLGLVSIKGGKLLDKPFLIFTVGMLLGQLGAGIETFIKEAWGAHIVQVYFFIFTAIAGIKRYRQMRG